DGEDRGHAEASQIRVHEIVRGGESSGIDAPIAQNDSAGRTDQKAGVEIAAWPFRIALELVSADVDAALPGKLLQRFGDRTGNGTAGFVDPFRGWQAVRRPLQRKTGPHHETRGIRAAGRGIQPADNAA